MLPNIFGTYCDIFGILQSVSQDDCVLLPLVHSTAEELAHYFFVRLLREFTIPYLHARGVTDMEVTVAEFPRQEVSEQASEKPLARSLVVAFFL